MGGLLMICAWRASAALALLLSACAAAIPACPAGLTPMVRAELFFGDGLPGGGTVSEAEWQEFVDREVTPRFPAGFTVLATFGQWKRVAGSIAREHGHDLVIVFTQSAAEARRINDVRSAYEHRFQQESVLLAEAPVCADF